MKYALALGGGGTRGAFEVGVWHALNELGIEIEAITGTSIGAVNGAVFASGLDADDLWLNIRATDIAEIKGNNLFSPMSLFGAVKDLTSGGIDASAFKDFLARHIDEKLTKLYKFYDKGLPHVGWERYKVVDVRYDKQIICRN